MLATASARQRELQQSLETHMLNIKRPGSIRNVVETYGKRNSGLLNTRLRSFRDAEMITAL